MSIISNNKLNELIDAVNKMHAKLDACAPQPKAISHENYRFNFDDALEAADKQIDHILKVVNVDHYVNLDNCYHALMRARVIYDSINWARIATQHDHSAYRDELNRLASKINDAKLTTVGRMTHEHLNKETK